MATLSQAHGPYSDAIGWAIAAPGQPCDHEASVNGDSPTDWGDELGGS